MYTSYTAQLNMSSGVLTIISRARLRRSSEGVTVVDIRVSCPCGNEMVMSEFAVGMRTTCPKCGKPLNVNWKNSRPLDSEEAPMAVPVSEEAAKGDASLFDEGAQPEEPRLGKNQCERCGREFRGEWDRHETLQGVLCNICVNLVQQTDPTNPSSGYVAPIDTLRLEQNADPIPAPTIETSEDDRSWLEKNWPSDETMHKVALYSGVAVVVLAALVFLFSGFGAPEPSPSSGTAVENGTAPTISHTTGVAYFIIQGITSFVGAYIGLYIFLAWANRLPNETLTFNLIALTPVALGIGFLWFIPFTFWFLVLARWMFVAILIFTVYGFEWGDLFRFPASFIMARVLKFFLYVMLMGILGLLGT